MPFLSKFYLFCSNNTFFINYTLKFKRHHSRIKIDPPTSIQNSGQKTSSEEITCKTQTETKDNIKMVLEKLDIRVSIGLNWSGK